MRVPGTPTTATQRRLAPIPTTTHSAMESDAHPMGPGAAQEPDASQTSPTPKNEVRRVWVRGTRTSSRRVLASIADIRPARGGQRVARRARGRGGPEAAPARAPVALRPRHLHRRCVRHVRFVRRAYFSFPPMPLCSDTRADGGCRRDSQRPAWSSASTCRTRSRCSASRSTSRASDAGPCCSAPSPSSLAAVACTVYHTLSSSFSTFQSLSHRTLVCAG